MSPQSASRDNVIHTSAWTISSSLLFMCMVVSIGGLYVAVPDHFVAHWNYYSMGVVIAASLVWLWFGCRLVDEVSDPKVQHATSKTSESKADTGYEGLGRGERTSLRGGVTRGKPEPPKQDRANPSSDAAKNSDSQRQSNAKKGSQEASSRPQAPPDSPRTTALKLVGERLSPEQAAKAAAKIVSLHKYVVENEPVTLNTIWSFFDMDIPTGSSYSAFDASDPKIVKLKGNLNRQRLLMHPDKNGHPDAEKTFKFLEQCHQRLTSVCINRNTKRNESMHERTRREEDELRVEEARRRREEEDRKQREEQMQKEEDEKQRAEEEKARRAEEEKERLEAMVKDKEARQTMFAERRKALGSGQKSQASLSLGQKPVPKPLSLDEPVLSESTGRPPALDPSQPVGQLTVHLLSAKDLPPQGFLFATGAYAKVRCGVHRVYSQPMPGNSPAWMRKFQFDVHRVDTALRIEVYREAPGSSWGVSVVEDELIGSVEIPFLDLQEWSDAPDEVVFGRLLENNESPEKIVSSILELKASLTWY